jgi:hypothetical protein
MADKTLLRFNIKNAKYALKSSSGYETPVAFGYSDAIALEADYSEKTIYGDGRKIMTIPNDKGKTGTLTLLTLDEAYEIAMKRRMKTASGTAEIKQLTSVEHAIYFETDYMDEEGNQKTAKTIVYGVTSGRPSQAYNQTTDDINNNNTDYPLTIKGTPLMDSAGTSAYKDSAGNTIYVWQETVVPEDTGYEEFGKTIAAPKAKTTLGI